MGNDWVLAKTAVGVDEIATRSRRIPPRLRTVLILVDGRRSVQTLAESAAALGDIRQALAELHEQGLVVLVSHGAHGAEAASRAAVAPDCAPGSQPPTRARHRPAAAPLRWRASICWTRWSRACATTISLSASTCAPPPPAPNCCGPSRCAGRSPAMWGLATSTSSKKNSWTCCPTKPERCKQWTLFIPNVSPLRESGLLERCGYRLTGPCRALRFCGVPRHAT
jgi:hypothetical protein